MDNDAEKLKRLKLKYGATVEIWLKKHTPESNQVRYEYLTKVNDMLCGRLEPSKKYRVNSLEAFLVKSFPKADFIELSDSDEENDNRSDNSDELLREIVENNAKSINDEISKSLQQELQDNNSVNDVLEPTEKKNPEPAKIKPRRPSMFVPSIAEYSLKTQKLPPSSAYAKKSALNKPAFSINYKEKKPIKPQYNPTDEENLIKLNNVKEKIYCKQFLKINGEKKKPKIEDKSETKFEDNTEPKIEDKIEPTVKNTTETQNDLPSSSSDMKLSAKSPYKMRPRAKSINYNVIELLSESEEEFKKIPILKTCRPVRKNWRPV